jgi:hypothetical protein
MKQKLMLRLLGCATGVLADMGIAQACSVCITGANDPTAEAFNASVLFLMFTPYLVVGSIAGALYLAYRRAAAKRDQDSIAESIVQLALNQEESGR